jgi:NAD(P)-dependent dehydrogenase (short-subunit alcohol dehydrogenase family)
LNKTKSEEAAKMSAQEHKGRVAIITGGGRGFGKAFGHALAARGAHVVQVDIDAEAGEQAAAEIRRAGGSASAFAADVNDDERISQLITDTVNNYGGIDILINNAGLHSAEFAVPMATTGVPRLRRLFDTNVMGTIVCTLATQDAMKGRPNACIINISSAAGYGAGTAYGVTKLAVRGLTMASARELGPFGIRVNAIAPGLIFTETIREELPPEMVKGVMAQQILPIEGEERDIVEAMLYLVSEQARFVSGETLRVSAGLSMSIG